MEDKINELQDKRDALIEELAQTEDRISKTPIDAPEYETLCQTQDTIEEQITVVEKEIELLVTTPFVHEQGDYTGATEGDR